MTEGGWVGTSERSGNEVKVTGGEGGYEGSEVGVGATSFCETEGASTGEGGRESAGVESKDVKDEPVCSERSSDGVAMVAAKLGLGVESAASMFCKVWKV